MREHDHDDCHLCALVDLDHSRGSENPPDAWCSSVSDEPGRTAVGEHLASIRTSISHLEWQYSRLIETGAFPASASGSPGNAGSSLTGVIAALGQVRRALTVADSAWATAQTRSARLAYTTDIDFIG